jgi:hypothetical protein
MGRLPAHFGCPLLRKAQPREDTPSGRRNPTAVLNSRSSALTGLALISPSQMPTSPQRPLRPRPETTERCERSRRQDDQILTSPTLVRRLRASLKRPSGSLANIERVLVGLDIRPVES